MSGIWDSNLLNTNGTLTNGVSTGRLMDRVPYLPRNQLTNTKMYHNISTLFVVEAVFCTTAVQGRRAAQPYKMRAEKKEGSEKMIYI